MQLSDNGQSRDLKEWGLALLDDIAQCATLLDNSHQVSAYSDSLALQRSKLENPALTPSARVLEALAEHNNSFFRFALAQSKAHAREFHARPLDAETLRACKAQADSSLAEQAAIEAADEMDFDRFVESYLSQRA